MITTLLKELWQGAIQSEYNKGLIATERAMQAVFYSELRKALPEHECWVEPTFWVQTETKPHPFIKPDLVITEGDKILCIIELKHFPSGHDGIKRDLAKLMDLSIHPKEEGYLIKIKPETGKYTSARYKICSSTSFVMACIARKPWWGRNDVDLDSIVLLSYDQRKLCILAGTIGKEVQFFCIPD